MNINEEGKYYAPQCFQGTPRSCNLSDSLREAVVAGVRDEFEAREQKLKEAYANQLEKLTADFNARLAAKQNEINQLKGTSDCPSANS